MSKMKGMLGAYAMMMAMASMGDPGYSERSEYRELTDEEKEQLKAIAEKKRIERLKQKGVSEYFYGVNSVYARDQKNADRKARNKGYL
jgi:hydroxylamine reductase (hybrid-cluster protein)